MDSQDAAGEVSRFIGGTFERYRMLPIARAELEPMMFVARWLCERREEGGCFIWRTRNSIRRLYPRLKSGEEPGPVLGSDISRRSTIMKTADFRPYEFSLRTSRFL